MLKAIKKTNPFKIIFWKTIQRWIEPAKAWWWVVVAVFGIMIYLVSYFVLPRIISPGIDFYLIRPILWLLQAFLAYLGWKYTLEEHPLPQKRLILNAALFGFIQTIIFVLLGIFVGGFGRSPYSHRFPIILGNLTYVITMLIGMEMSRAYLVIRFGQKKPLLSISIVGLFLFLLNVPIGWYLGLQSQIPRLIFQIIGELMLPSMAENFLATYLTFVGGPIASMAYMGMLKAFEWLSPALPSLRWYISAIVGTLVPLGMPIIQEYAMSKREQTQDNEKKQSKGTLLTWAVVGVLSLLILWFNTGLLGVHPTLIASGSMEPSISIGDVAVIQGVPIETIKEGDVIAFRQNGLIIVHRVKKIENNEGEITFITQGDNNNTQDPPVPAQNVDGKVVMKLPKIGWVTIFLRKIIAAIL
jgi:signal peptidase